MALLNESFPSGSANVIVESGVYSAAIRLVLQVSYRTLPVYLSPFFATTTTLRAFPMGWAWLHRIY